MSDDHLSPEDIIRARQLEPLHEAWSNWPSAQTLPLIQDLDPTMRTLASEEFTTLTNTLSTHIFISFPSLLVPPSSPRDSHALLELKAGVGGFEAALFLLDLLQIYIRFAGSVWWRTHKAMKHSGRMHVFKSEVAYDALRWTSVVHCVWRVYQIILSTCLINSNHCPQHFNKTKFVVRLTHTPTGIIVFMRDECSQHQPNWRRVFQVLRTRLTESKVAQDIVSRRATCWNLVRTADRSEKIRTYTYAQDRVTDHRVSLSRMNLTGFLQLLGHGRTQIKRKELLNEFLELSNGQCYRDRTLPYHWTYLAIPYGVVT
ncbi:peptide chain release factor 1 [Suillus paluster]|uniref:peptide chain release factor 1 n=1 Tax=Suillus paluster TaxID=48578 RepID=UPI001B87F846|nr:peptide chain release factor 1 [Suillus paluster]KAG1720350.1 peptide chain release factor 1 [Suillus paluster]